MRAGSSRVDPVRQPLGRVTTVEAAVEAAGARPGRRILAFGFVAAPRAGRDRTRRSSRRRGAARSSASTSPTTSRSRSSTVWVGADLGAEVSRADVERAPFYDLLPCTASSSASVHQTITAEVADAADRRAARRRARRAAAVRLAPHHFDADGDAGPLLGAPLSRRPHHLRDRVLAQSGVCNMAELVGPTTPAALVEAAYAQFPERVAHRARAARAPADVRREGAVRPRRRPADGRPRTRRRLRRLPARPRRDAGRDRADGAAAVHARRAADGRRAVDGALRPPDPGAHRRRRRHAGRDRHEPRGLRVPAHGVARSTASASGSRAAGSSTRSCSRTTRSPAG